MKRALAVLCALFLLVSTSADANQAYFGTGVTTNGNSVDIPASEFHVAVLCVTVASGALTSLQVQVKDPNGTYYSVGTSLTATGCTTISEYAQGGANVALGAMVRAIWVAGTANFSWSLYLKR
jgi:hypothetical protein